jgi:hypothetical protein
MKALMAVSLALLCATDARAQAAGAAPRQGSVAIEQSSNPNTLPGDATEAQLRAWANRYIKKGTFVETDAFMHADPSNRIFLYDPTSVQKLPNGHVTAWFRIELFRPRMMEGYSHRSVHKKLEIDCSDLRYKELIIESFAEANMQQRVPDITFTPAFGNPELQNSPQGIVARRVCSDANTSR